MAEKSELRRNFYSVPDLVQITISNNKAIDSSPETNNLSRNHKSQEDINGQENTTSDDSSMSPSQLSHINNVKMKNKNNIYSQQINPPNKGEFQ